MEKLLIESCLEMSSILLQQWYPDGSRRESSKSEREFKNDVEEFFEDVKCTGYDDDVQEYIEDSGRRRNRVKKGSSESVPLQREGSVGFLSAASVPNKVQKVNALRPDKVIFNNAEKILKQGEKLTKKSEEMPKKAAPLSNLDNGRSRPATADAVIIES